MLRLIFAFVDVMLHRRGPEDLPSSRFLLWSLFAVAIGVNLAILLAGGGGALEVAVSVLISLLDLWFVWALLRTFSREGRFRQTMSAMLGTGIILRLIGAPLVPLLPEPVAASVSAAGAVSSSVTLPELVLLLLSIWSVDIGAFVFTRAIERPYLLCVAVVLGYAMLILALQATALAAAK